MNRAPPVDCPQWQRATGGQCNGVDHPGIGLLAMELAQFLASLPPRYPAGGESARGSRWLRAPPTTTIAQPKRFTSAHGAQDVMRCNRPVAEHRVELSTEAVDNSVENPSASTPNPDLRNGPLNWRNFRRLDFSSYYSRLRNIPGSEYEATAADPGVPGVSGSLCTDWPCRACQPRADRVY